MAARTAQAFMSAARLADETKSATIALFPPATVYRLAAKSTPPEIKDTILQRAAGGDVASDREVKKIIDHAAHQRRVEKEEAAKKERRARRQESARTKARREQEEREADDHARWIKARADAVVALIVRNLDARARAELLELINGVFDYSTPSLIHDGLLAELQAPIAPPVADAFNVPESTSWDRLIAAWNGATDDDQGRLLVTIGWRR